MNFPIRPVLEEIKSFSGLGFDYLELAMDPPQAHHSMIRQQKKDLLKALDQCNMGIVCHLPTFVSTADLTDSLREISLREVYESLSVAAELRALKVVLHPGHIGGLGVFVIKKAKRYVLDSLQAISDKASQLGLSVCIENMFPRSNSLVNPEDFIPVFKKFPDLRLTLDTGHAHMGSKGGKRTQDFISKLGGRIGHVHANDNFGKEDNHLPVGAGTIDFPRITKALKEIGYNETITLEIFSRDRDYLKMSRDKLAAMFAAQ